MNFPDVNGDVVVNANDSSLILNAYTKILSGKDPGLNECQLKAANADMDGKITASDNLFSLFHKMRCRL